MNLCMRIRLAALASACVLPLVAATAWSQRLTWLGTLGGNYSIAYRVSADGRVVVGYARASDEQRLAFRWENGVMQDLGTLGGDESRAYAVSADGRVVVGGARDAFGRWRAFRWENGIMQDLNSPSERGSQAEGISADGRISVGYIFNAAGRLRAARWENGAAQDLSVPLEFSSAKGISADGRVVVGWGTDTAWRAFRWENGISQVLGTLGGNDSWAYAVSADGQVVVGIAQEAGGRWRAFRWTPTGGIENLTNTYAALLTDGSRLVTANAISPDGRYIVGNGYNAAASRFEAFLLDTGSPPRGDVDRSGCVDDADLLAVLLEFGGHGYRDEDITWDGSVDDADLLEVLFNFGHGC